MSGICEHGRIRSTCKECGGSQICEHGRQRKQCKECGGSQICEHGHQRPKCKECRAVKAKAEAELLDDVDAAEQGVKRKRAPHTKVPCPHGVKYRSTARCAALVRTVVGAIVQGVRWVTNLRARSCTLSVQGVRWVSNLRARSSALYVQGVRWVKDMRARSSAL